MLDLHVLMTDFLRLEQAIVGRGYKHPTEPNPAVKGDTLRFLEEYPLLRRDEGYIDFSECYAGASAWEQQGGLGIDLFGFIDGVATHLIYGEGPVVEEQGYLYFCGGLVRQKSNSNLFPGEIVSQGFAFDATGQRPWGVYRGIPTSKATFAGKATHTYWYCATFLECLDILIRTNGRVPDQLD